MRWLRLACAVLVVACLRSPTIAAAHNELLCRIVDVGAGHCAAVRVPGAAAGSYRYMIYDAGNASATAKQSISQIIPLNSEVELLVLSHTDSDHLGEVPWICQNYVVKRRR